MTLGLEHINKPFFLFVKLSLYLAALFGREVLVHIVPAAAAKQVVLTF